MIHTNLSFATLRAANIARLPLFKNALGAPAHAKPDGSDWSLGEWMNAILGELGEAANIVKKLKRGDFNATKMREMQFELGRELADVVTYLDLTAHQMSFDLTLLGFHGQKILTFGELRTATREANLTVDEIRRRSLGEWMNAAASHFGAAAGRVNEISLGQFGLENCRREISYHFGSVLGILDIVSEKAGTPLGTDVLVKFNDVSRRVAANVFINAGDEVEIDNFANTDWLRKSQEKNDE